MGSGYDSVRWFFHELVEDSTKLVMLGFFIFALLVMSSTILALWSVTTIASLRSIFSTHPPTSLPPPPCACT